VKQRSSGYTEEQDRKAGVIAKFLVAHPDQGITRARLASRLTTVKDRYSPSIITALWPLVERHVETLQDGLLWAMRPIAQNLYRCAATTSALSAQLVSIKRENRWYTMMVNDLEKGRNLHRLESDPRFGPDAIRRVYRIETYLVMFREAVRQGHSDEHALVEEMLRLEEIP
jgi:hypothetical protein